MRSFIIIAPSLESRDPSPIGHLVSVDQTPGLSTHECGQNLAKDVASFQESRGRKVQRR